MSEILVLMAATAVAIIHVSDNEVQMKNEPKSVVDSRASVACLRVGDIAARLRRPQAPLRHSHGVRPGLDRCHTIVPRTATLEPRGGFRSKSQIIGCAVDIRKGHVLHICCNSVACTRRLYVTPFCKQGSTRLLA